MAYSFIMPLGASQTGLTFYGVEIDSSATPKFWNQSGTPAFETYNASNWTTAAYCITMSEVGSSGIYYGTIPSNAAAAAPNSILVYRRVGGSPALASDLIQAAFSFCWDGSQIVSAPYQTGTGSGQFSGASAGIASVNVIQVNGTTVTIQPTDYTAGVVNDGSPTSSTFATTIANGTTADQYKYGVLMFTSGALNTLARAITGWGTNTKPTLNAAFPTAPANGDSFIIMGCAK